MTLADKETRRFWAGNNVPGKKGFQPKSSSKSSADSTEAAIAKGRASEGFGGTMTPLPGDSVRIAGDVQGKGKKGVVAESNGSFHTVKSESGKHIGYFHSSDLEVTHSPTRLQRATTLPEMDRANYGDRGAEKRWARSGGPPSLYD